MEQRSFSDNGGPGLWNNSSVSSHYNDALIFPGVAQVKSTYQNLHRPVISTMLHHHDTGRNILPLSKMKYTKAIASGDNRLTRNTFLDNKALSQAPNNQLPIQDSRDSNIPPKNMTIKNYYQIPTASRFFPSIDDHDSNEQKDQKDTVIIPDNYELPKENETIQVKAIIMPRSYTQAEELTLGKGINKTASIAEERLGEVDEKADFMIEGLPMENQIHNYNHTADPLTCIILEQSKAHIDAQEKFCKFNIEPPWMAKRQYWNRMFDSRYNSLMRNSKWPPLKVILIPRTHVDTIWIKTFEQYHTESVSKILSYLVKKLLFYNRLTFSWNEVSHLSQWWKNTSQKTRSAFRKLVKGGRLEITTGGWVETDEATTHLFGLTHQLIEGHQWLKSYLGYSPDVAWLTNSVTHSPTMTYLLSKLNIHKIVFTNLHYSWEQFLAEYQCSDFIWQQNWDHDKSYPSKLNDDLARIGNDRYTKHAVMAHYLQFNEAGFRACGPNHNMCDLEYNFVNPGKNLDITPYNIKEKAEKLLEQYSKTGTISLHNTIIAPIGGAFHYERQTEFDYQYNNYLKIADFINTNKDIYKATIEFGTAHDYFNYAITKHKDYPTLKGDFLNFADLNTGAPAYWTGFYTSRPFTKILLRRLQSTLRTTEILFSFALNLNVFRGYNLSEAFELLINARKNVARLLDRNVAMSTVSANALKYVHNKILETVKDCWHIQELSASFLTLKPNKRSASLQKYVYRDGEFISVFRSVSPGDQIYIFNSLSYERTEIVEIVTRTANIRILDHQKKDVTIQINPVWKYSSDNLIKLSRRFFKISFPVMVPPMTLALYKIKDTYDATHNVATIYCLACILDEVKTDRTTFPFSIHPIQSGDIQLESYKHRLIFDEYTGFLKTVVEKETNIEKTVFIDYGAFRDSSSNSGMFLFSTNVSKPLHDMLTSYRLGKKSKVLLILSGQVSAEMITIYGRLLQHTTKIYNLVDSPLANAIYVESKVDYEVSPKNRDLEMFITIQTDIMNGNPPQIFTDNNSYQYTSRVLNISRRVESNMYPITSMAFIQDNHSRLTFITDHAQGVTALQEGQLVVILDRRVLFNDGRGTDEGLADSSATCNRHYILLENFIDQSTRSSSQNKLILPSLHALYLANTLSYLIDVFVIEKNHTDLCFYTFLPLIKTSFPCDVFVVNYRVFLKYNVQSYSPNAALMILHRQSFSCNVVSMLSPHCHGDSNFAIDKILRNIRAVYQTNLAGTSDGESVLNFDLNNFPPMELMSLRIDF